MWKRWLAITQLCIKLNPFLYLARRNLYLAWMERASPLSIYLPAILSSIIAELATDCAHAHTECLQYECIAKVTKVILWLYAECIAKVTKVILWLCSITM